MVMEIRSPCSHTGQVPSVLSTMSVWSTNARRSTIASGPHFQLPKPAWSLPRPPTSWWPRRRTERSPPGEAERRHGGGRGLLGMRRRNRCPLVEHAPPDRRPEALDVLRTHVNEVRVGLGDEIADHHDPPFVGQANRGHGLVRASHLGAHSHGPHARSHTCHSQATVLGVPPRSVEAGQGLMMTLVPTGTRGYSSWESEMYIRMHP